MTITVTTGTHPSSDLVWANIIAEYCLENDIELEVKMGQVQNKLVFSGSDDSLQDLLDHFNSMKENKESDNA